VDDFTWSLIETERRTLADLLVGLTADQWQTPSLCAEWTVRDVAAHVAMTPARAPDVATMLTALTRTRGRLWAAGRDVAIQYGKGRSCEQLVAELRRDAVSRRRPVFVTDDNILLDLLVHGQDIAVPLGIVRVVPEAAGVLALTRLWGMGWPFHARRRFRGVRLVADGGWSAGAGPEIHGSDAELLLLMTGRTQVALDRLKGPGVEALRAREPGVAGSRNGLGPRAADVGGSRADRGRSSDVEELKR
jgi:uncharacterized protein (TIGR03083 family)